MLRALWLTMHASMVLPTRLSLRFMVIYPLLVMWDFLTRMLRLQVRILILSCVDGKRGSPRRSSLCLSPLVHRAGLKSRLAGVLATLARNLPETSWGIPQVPPG